MKPSHHYKKLLITCNMAVRDFKKYLVKIQGQYLEMKADLADFDEAFRNGHITEEQLKTAKDDVYVVEQNYQRLLYVAYLLEMPRKEAKKEKYARANKKVTKALSEMKADEQSVFDENKSALDHLRKELKELTKKGK